jgi:hypothetical protein
MNIENAYTAYQAAVKAVRKQGINIAQNLAGDGCACGCSGYKTPKAWGDKNTAENYAFTRKRDALDWNSYSTIGRAFWAWSGVTPSGAPIAAAVLEAFTSHGFKTEWDGTEYSCVIVDVDSWNAANATI